MDKVSTSKVYTNWPVVIDEQGFRRLYSEIQELLEKGSKVEFRIKYYDKSSVDTESIELLINDENHKGRKIQQIKITGKNTGKEVQISFGQTKIVKDEAKFYSNIFLDITGPTRQWVYVTQSQIEDRLKSFKASHPSIYVIVAITCIAVTALFFWSCLFFKEALPFFFSFEKTTGKDGLNGAFFVTVGVMNLLALIPCAYLYKNLTFAIGAEIEEHKNRLRARAQLFWVIVGIPIAILITLFLQK